MIKPRKFKLLSKLILITVLLAGCGANSLVIRYFYGEVDDKLYDRILAYATFTEVQKEQIRKSVDEYSNWHKQNELPRYEIFLNQIAAQITAGNLTTEIVLTDFEKARDFAKTSFERSPFYDSAEFLKTLSDQQIDQIQNNFTKHDGEFQQWQKKRLQDDGDQERLNRIVKNTKRITNINLNTDQQEIIRQSLDQIQNDPLKRHTIYNRWQDEFIRILNKRHEQDFAKTISAHIATYQNLVKLDNPEQYENNQKIVAKLIPQIVANLDEKQKQALLNRVKKIRETLISITKS